MREISICCRNCSHCSCSYVDFPPLPISEHTGLFCLSDPDDQEELLENETEANDHTTVSNATKKSVKIVGREGDYQIATAVHDRYPARPNKLENMVLAQFAISYVVAYKIPKSTQFDNEGCSTDLSDQTIYNTFILLPNHITLKENMGILRLRTFPQVLRYHLSKRKEGHEEHYSELLLFCSWRNEVGDFQRHDPKKCIEIYEKRKDEWQRNKKAIFPGEDIIDIIETNDLEEMKPLHLYDMIASQNMQQNDDDLDSGVTDDPDYESFGYTGNLAQNCEKITEDCKYRCVKLPNENELKEITRRLVPEQMDALRKIMSTMKNIIRAKENSDFLNKPLRLVVHGGAGVGKSAFIKAASLQAEKILRQPGDDPNYPHVLICAPTGKAASLIGKLVLLLLQ